MPYVTELDRNHISPNLRFLDLLTPGELTYALTLVLEGYRARHGDNFNSFADIVGALEQAKDEFQRRVVHPYEDAKREQNGDVYAPVRTPGIIERAADAYRAEAERKRQREEGK